MRRSDTRSRQGRPWEGILVAALLCACGCLAKPALTVASYSIDPPPARSAPPAAGKILSLENVRVASPYTGRAFVYRTGGHQVERDAYAVFAAPPGWLLTSAIRGYLGNADGVRDVELAGGDLPADARVSVDVIDLYGDLEHSAETSAVLTLKFRVLRPEAGDQPASEVLNRTYTRSVRASERTAAATADAWNRGLAEIMKEFLADLDPVLAAARPAS